MEQLIKNNVYLMDCVEGLKKMDSNTAQIIICDCPYNIGKDFDNNSDKQVMSDYLDWCDKWIKECLRVLKPNGTMYIYGFSEILAFIRVRLTCKVRWLIWHYTNKTIPRLSFWQRSHESILACWKDSYHFNVDDVREPYTDTYVNNAAGKVRKSTKGRFSKGDKETTYTAHEKGALPRDVIKCPALAGGAGKVERVDHPTQKPLSLCMKLLAASKQNETDLVVIPFVGSGSEVVACKRLNLPFIGFEINEKYVELAKQRLIDEQEENTVENEPTFVQDNDNLSNISA
jgi:site-specific DNA-methyltransferase (adenine-specific)